VADSALSIELAGEHLIVDAQRALIWPAENTMFLADLHLGKSDIFRRAGIPIPEGGTTADLDRIESLVQRYRLQRVVLLGDFLHGRSFPQAGYTQTFAAWRRTRSDLDFTVVAGNHDRFDAFRSLDWNVTWQREGVSVGPFICRHHPESSRQGFVLAGHVHPVMFLYGSARERLRVPVLWIRDGHAVLPSFGSFTGGAEVSPAESESVYAFAADRVWKVAGKASA
jgi:DNA ligase-associated metallophosphoesterase